jgi:radical SAM enzyme (TIGR01210 family)
METSIQKRINKLYREYGLGKPMGEPSLNSDRPHFFLHRRFLFDQDLLIIFNTKRCRYQCKFCDLPNKSSITDIPSALVLNQFEYVMTELKHSLGVLNRLTISNEGSVLDTETFPPEALLSIMQCTTELKAMRTIVLETRLEFVNANYLREISAANTRATIDILTGFETLNQEIRDDILGKREPINVFLEGLNTISGTPTSLTAYVLFKASPFMTDKEGFEEAENSIIFLRDQCMVRKIPFTIRLNPMYSAKGSKWSEQAHEYLGYQPPRLSDVLNLAEKMRGIGISIYIGLSTEGLGDPKGTFRDREDFSKDLLKRAIKFNSL